MTSAEEFGQLRPKFTDPVQHLYEVIRSIVLFSETISERSRQTGIERTQIGQKAQRFVHHGMFGLVDQRGEKAGRKPHEYPEAVATEILLLPVQYDWSQKRLHVVSQPTLYQTLFVSPQLEMFELEQWLKVCQRSYQRQQKRLKPGAKQLLFPGLEVAV